MKFLRRNEDGLNDVDQRYLDCKEIVAGVTKSLIYVYPVEEMEVGFYIIAEYIEEEQAWVSHSSNFFNGFIPQDEATINS